METKETLTEIIQKKRMISIGIATIVCDKDGKIIEAMFDPTLKVKDCTDLVSALKQIDGPIEKQSELVVASWFERVDSIQLADRLKWKMVSKSLGPVNMPKNYPEGAVGHVFHYMMEEL